MDREGLTPLLAAARAAYQKSGARAAQRQCVALCVQHGAQLNTARCPEGRTAIFYISAIGATDELEYMVSVGRADVHATCRQGMGAIHFAAAHGQPDSLRLLLSHGAQAEAVDARGRFVLEHALIGMPGVSLPGKGHADCHRLLLRHMAR
uniref:Uncharacterized protein n=1 Tax=Calcidiscus leptoporus TaxID=127549 RepID=A0A7S0JJJ5_9EUKA